MPAPKSPRPSPAGFVALASLKRGQPSTDEALAEIRRIYFKTTAKTIEHDFAHAIDLLKGLDTEASREKASVFMEGIAELRKEWTPRPRAGAGSGKSTGARTRSTPRRKTPKKP